MVDTCTVSFTARDTQFALRPGQTVVFRPTEPLLDAIGATLRIRRAVSVTAGPTGAASVALTPGAYVLEAQVDGRLTNVPCIVPDLATASIDDCLYSVPAETFNAFAILMQGLGLRFYPNIMAAESDIMLKVGDYFFAPWNGGLSIFEKMVLTPAHVAPLFSAQVVPAGSAGAPGLSIVGDPDTGIYAPAANQLAGTVGGIVAWLASATALQINVPVTGAALTGSNLDETAGKLLKVGDYGLGAGSAVDITDWNNATVNGAIYDGNSIANAPIATGWFIGTYHRMTSIFGIQKVTGVSGTGAGRSFERRLDSGTWGAWREVFNQGSILGTVSQTGGVPTGAVIQRGSNANGEFVRFADGTQICTRTNLSAANASTALGSLFRSADVAWTFPIAFAAAPAVQGDVDDGDCWLTTSGAPGTASVNVRALAAVTKGSALTLRATAVGRWF